MRITVIDPTSAEGQQWLATDFEAWARVFHAALSIGRSRPNLGSIDSLRSSLGQPDPRLGARVLFAGEPSDPVGAARIMLPLSENTGFAWVEGGTRPDLLRRGIGTALLGAAEDAARSLGRTQLGPETRHDSGREGPGAPFLRRSGYHVDLVTVRRSWDLTSTDLSAVQRRFGLPEGYSVRTWVGATPPELVPTMARLRTQMSADVPTGEAMTEVAHWDEDRVVELDELRLRVGHLAFTALAIAPDGSAAGYTDLHRTADGTEIHQQDTMVAADHRGQRLGAALKVAAVILLREHVPSARWVDTWNASSNRPMVRINEALGFVPTEDDLEWIAPL